MKKPNDHKRPNSSSPSLGRFYRLREVLTHCSVAYQRHEITDPVSGVVSVEYRKDLTRSKDTYRKPGVM